MASAASSVRVVLGDHVARAAADQRLQLAGPRLERRHRHVAQRLHPQRRRPPPRSARGGRCRRCPPARGAWTYPGSRRPCPRGSGTERVSSERQSMSSACPASPDALIIWSMMPHMHADPLVLRALRGQRHLPRVPRHAAQRREGARRRQLQRGAGGQPRADGHVAGGHALPAVQVAVALAAAPTPSPARTRSTRCPWLARCARSKLALLAEVQRADHAPRRPSAGAGRSTRRGRWPSAARSRRCSRCARRSGSRGRGRGPPARAARRSVLRACTTADRGPLSLVMLRCRTVVMRMARSPRSRAGARGATPTRSRRSARRSCSAAPSPAPRGCGRWPPPASPGRRGAAGPRRRGWVAGDLAAVSITSRTLKPRPLPRL